MSPRGVGGQAGLLSGWALALGDMSCLCPPSAPGYADHMGLAQFRRRFQALDPALLKKLASPSEGVDERKVRPAAGAPGAWGLRLGSEALLSHGTARRAPGAGGA